MSTQLKVGWLVGVLVSTQLKVGWLVEVLVSTQLKVGWLVGVLVSTQLKVGWLVGVLPDAEKVEGTSIVTLQKPLPSFFTRSVAWSHCKVHNNY